MAKKIDAKEIGLTLLLGSGVVVLTPILANLGSGIGLLAFEIVPNVLTVGMALSAGISAFAMGLAIDTWLR